MNSVRRHHRKADLAHSIGDGELDQRPNEAKYGAGRDDRTMGRLSHGELKPVDGESNPVRLGKPQRSPVLSQVATLPTANQKFHPASTP